MYGNSLTMYSKKGKFVIKNIKHASEKYFWHIQKCKVKIKRNIRKKWKRIIFVQNVPPNHHLPMKQSVYDEYALVNTLEKRFGFILSTRKFGDSKTDTDIARMLALHGAGFRSFCQSGSRQTPRVENTPKVPRFFCAYTSKNKVQIVTKTKKTKRWKSIS